MKKQHTFSQLSSTTCAHPGCIKKLKLRLVENKPTMKLCYMHYREQEAHRGHFVDTQPRKKRVKAELPVKSY